MTARQPGVDHRMETSGVYRFGIRVKTIYIGCACGKEFYGKRTWVFFDKHDKARKNRLPDFKHTPPPPPEPRVKQVTDWVDKSDSSIDKHCMLLRYDSKAYTLEVYNTISKVWWARIKRYGPEGVDDPWSSLNAVAPSLDKLNEAKKEALEQATKYLLNK